MPYAYPAFVLSVRFFQLLRIVGSIQSSRSIHPSQTLLRRAAGTRHPGVAQVKAVALVALFAIK